MEYKVLIYISANVKWNISAILRKGINGLIFIITQRSKWTENI